MPDRQVREIPFKWWHRHREWELTLTLDTRGMRFIGDHIGACESHELVLPEMPHTWASTRAIDEARGQVKEAIWFTKAWALQVAEMLTLRGLLERTAAGLRFAVGGGSDDGVAVAGAVVEIGSAETQKIVPMATDEASQVSRILKVLHQRFAEPLRVRDLCAVGNLSARSLHRLLVRHRGENLSDYLGRLRRGRACMWLVETDRPINVIAGEAGFSNPADFNRQVRSAPGNDAEGVPKAGKG